MRALQLSHCVVDLSSRVVRGPGGEEQPLTQLEASLLEHLASLGGGTATREELLARVWGYNENVVSRAVDTTVKRLRAKIEANAKEPEHLLTEWGTGYKLVGLGVAEQSPPPVGDLVLACAVLPDARQLRDDLGDTWVQAQARTMEVARNEIGRSSGYLVREDGDELLVAFASCRQALGWAVAVQEALHRERWSESLQAHPLASPVEVGGELVLCGVRVGIALVQGGARALGNPTTGRTEYAGVGVRQVRAMAARTPGGAIRGEPSLVEAAALPVHRVEVAGTHWLELLPQSLAGRARARPRISGRDRIDLFGRDAEIEQLAGALERHRLVTLIGPGGMGKTTLAAELFESLGRAGWFCRAEHARTLDDFVTAVAEALELDLAVPDLDQARERVRRALADRGGAPLLVLDNLEQLPSEVAVVVEDWLQRVPRLGVIATSRRPLGLEGEHRFELGPLSSSAATELMVSRVSEARGGAPCSDEERADIEAIVEGLERIPLAIELAAARVRMLGVAGIRKRLAQSLKLLAGGHSKVTRHQSMTNAIAWSWELLEPWERAAMSQLSLFAGPFTADSAEHLVDLSEWPDAPWTLDVLEALQRHSLIHATSTGLDPRMQLLTPIRQFAAERLRPEERRPTEGRHAEWFAQRGDPEFVDGLDGADERLRKLQLATERADLFEATERALSRGDARTAARCWLGLAHYYDRFAPAGPALALEARLLDEGLSPRLRAARALSRGRLVRQAEGASAARAPFQEALELAVLAADHRLIGRAATWAALAAFDCGEPDAEGLLAQALEHSALARDGATEAFARMLLGVLRSMRGDATGAVDTLQQSLAVARAIGANGLRGRVLTNLGSALHAAGKLDEAWRTYDAALPIHRAVGNRRSHGCLHINRGNLAVARGNLEDALIEFGEALGILRANANQMEEGIALLNLGQVHVVRGEPSIAERHLARALGIHDQTDNAPSRAYTLTNLAEVRRMQGRYEDATTLVTEALEIHRRGRHLMAIAGALLQAAEIHHSAADRERAIATAREVIDATATLDTPQLTGRAWALLAELHTEIPAEALPMAERAHRLLTEANDVEGLGIVASQLAVLEGDPRWLERARAAADQLGCSPASRLGTAVARAQSRISAGS